MTPCHGARSGHTDRDRRVDGQHVGVRRGVGGGGDVTESAALLPAIRTTEEVSGETYGGLKVACEEEVAAVVGAAWADGATGTTWVPLGRGGSVLLPQMVLPSDAPDALLRRDSVAAIKGGLTRRTLRETVTDPVAWDVQRGQPPLSVDPPPDQLAEVRTG